MPPRKESTATESEAWRSGLRDEDSTPPWQKASVERSLRAAREKAQKRSDQFVAAALAILDETGDTGFTVQDVVDRAKMSIRTFYGFFEGKEDLVVALHATILEREVTPRLRARCAKESNPLLRIRTFIDAIFELSSVKGPASKALTTFHYRLAEARPLDLELALRPQLDFVVELVGAAAEAGYLHTPLSPRQVGTVIHDLVLAAIHGRILGTEGDHPVSADEIWQFCATGLGVAPAEVNRKGGTRRAG